MIATILVITMALLAFLAIVGILILVREFIADLRKHINDEDPYYWPD